MTLTLLSAAFSVFWMLAAFKWYRRAVMYERWWVSMDKQYQALLERFVEYKKEAEREDWGWHEKCVELVKTLEELKAKTGQL